MKSLWETHKSKNIFYAHYDHIPLEDLRLEVVAIEEEMLKQPPDSVLLLCDVQGGVISPEALNLYKNVALHCNKILHKTAIQGISGAHKTIMDIVTKFAGLKVSPFETVQQVREWVTS